jgi:predicted DNA-binding transcriptional regulator AlpA
MDPLLNEKEAAMFMNVSVQLLRKMRANGTGPEHIKLAKCVRYSREDIGRYISSQRSSRLVIRNGQKGPVQ